MKLKRFNLKRCDLLWIFIFLLALVNGSNLYGGWDPEDLFFEYDLTCLEDSFYVHLKQDIKRHLENSWSTEEKIDLLMDLVYLKKPKICVEIGAFTGSSVIAIASALKANKSGKMYAIDAWSNKIATQYLEDSDPNKSWWSSVDMSYARRLFDKAIEKMDLSKYCVPIQKSSKGAVKEMAKLGGIDFLHLDGDHSEKGSMQDVENYIPLVKPGGYILLSNLFIMVNGEQPKLQAFCALFNECEYIGSVERDNAVLFRKE